DVGGDAAAKALVGDAEQVGVSNRLDGQALGESFERFAVGDLFGREVRKFGGVFRLAGHPAAKEAFFAEEHGLHGVYAVQDAALGDLAGEFRVVPQVQLVEHRDR